MQVTLDEKCTNFWGWDLPPVPPPSPLYASTWGAGVYITRDYAQSWQATNLGSKYVYAISVPTDEEVWAACESGVYYTEDEGENWEKQTMGTPSAQRDGESISEADLYFVGVETYMDEVYCLAGEDASRGIWMYKSEDKGENWTNKRIVG
jgi:ligand-binding sensor domain-containing protein